jgi:hypothetical protein
VVNPKIWRIFFPGSARASRANFGASPKSFLSVVVVFGAVPNTAHEGARSLENFFSEWATVSFRLDRAQSSGLLTPKPGLFSTCV